MKKFNIRKVLDGLTAASSSSSSSPSANQTQTTRYRRPCSLSTSSSVSFGRAGVECYCQHESGAAVIQLQFLINEGALVSALADDSIHLWNLRQKIPAVLHSLKFSRERITYCHLPFQSKWLYIGTEKGNIHIVNLLIGFECGIVVLWDLKCKKADCRYTYDEAIHSVSWHHEGKQFVCSHSDGTLTTWNIRAQTKPQIITPHGKQPKDGKKPEPCKPILKVEYKTSRVGSCLTVMHGRSTTLLEMDFPIVDFLTLCETPYPNDVQEPYAVLVLLEKDLVLIDLGQIGYPIFETPYPLTLHESPVTCCEYFVDCPSELIPALYSVGSRQKRQCFSKKEWPINGGNWGQGTQSYPEIIITGHADGSIKFWDASALMLQMLYKLKTAKVFERSRRSEEKGGSEMVDEDPFAIQTLSWCPESRMLCVAGVSAHIIIYRFSKQEVTTDTLQLLEVRMQSEFSEGDSPESPEQSLPPPPALRRPTPPLRPPTLTGPETTNPAFKCAPPLSNSLQVSRWSWWFSCCGSGGASSTNHKPRCQLIVRPRGVWEQQRPRCGGLPPEDSAPQHGNIRPLQPSRPSPEAAQIPRKTRHTSTAAGDSVDGSNTSEDRCKSPTSARISRKISYSEVNASFSRSRSSSVSSLDRESREVISSLSFCESFPRKGDASLGPSLLLGTSMGSVIMVALSLPPPGETRLQQPVGVAPCVVPSPPPSEQWYDPNGSEEDQREKRRRRPPRPPPVEGQDSQFLVLVSEKQAKPPPQTQHQRELLRAEGRRGDAGGGNCIACFCANGHIMTLSLPSLRPLLDVNYLPLTDMRIARTFCFSHLGQALYLTSPTEIQRLTYSQDTCEHRQVPDLRDPVPSHAARVPGMAHHGGNWGQGTQSYPEIIITGSVTHINDYE
ncbi:hypothetical protein F7725_008771 [Dissostichus mawsoni]|uniref:Lethal giant larvae homologue 2 domain-containing protein n=1 Tax=Dissostichus mawsoni TaxID=36200 RepID=A0A7J5YB97_DISMA|nr:hypothetical protein F7725_008771 [Dissostichus mawsoni]